MKQLQKFGLVLMVLALVWVQGARAWAAYREENHLIDRIYVGEEAYVLRDNEGTPDIIVHGHYGDLQDPNAKIDQWIYGSNQFLIRYNQEYPDGLVVSQAVKR